MAGELVPSSEKPRESRDKLQKIADSMVDLVSNSFGCVRVGTTGGRHEPTLYSESFVDPQKGPAAWSAASYNLVTEEETVAAYVYKMDRPWLTPDMMRVEIRRGRALWVIGQGDEPVKVGLPSLNKMRVSEATASMNADHVLTITIPKSHQPWKWYQYKNLVFAWFKTVHVAVSS